MQPKVSKGLATWAGIVAAVGQYAAAVAVFLADPDKATALGPLTTATVTLAVVIYGRMAQARNIAFLEATRPKAGSTVSLADLVEADRMRDRERAYAGSTPRPHAGGSFVPGDEDFDRYGAGDLGDPDALPDYSTAENPPPDEGDIEARP